MARWPLSPVLFVLEFYVRSLWLDSLSTFQKQLSTTQFNEFLKRKGDWRRRSLNVVYAGSKMEADIMPLVHEANDTINESSCQFA